MINLLWLNLCLLVWAGVWAITGKLVRHQYHFGQQLFIGTIWMILLILIYPLLGYVEFASNGMYPGFILPGSGESVSRYFAEIEEILASARED